MSEVTQGRETYSAREVELMREIMRDWLNEGLVLPPFEDDLEGLLKKMNLAIDDTAPEHYPKSQERLSRPGVK